MIHEDLKHDFGYFISGCAPRPFAIDSLSTAARPANWKKLFRFRESTVFRNSKGSQRICFFGSSFVEYNFRKRQCQIFCDDPAVLYETIYLVVLSYVGEQLGRMGAHRLHGFGFEMNGKGSVLLAPSGGGKSTLALELLKAKRTRILSDDTPVIGKDGKMTAFPQRNPLKKVSGVGEEHLRRFKRHKHGEKIVIGSSFFGSQILAQANVDWLIVSKRTTKKQSSVRRVHKLNAILPLLKWLVVGYETPQIWQLYLRASPSDVIHKIGILTHRLQVAGQLFKNAQVAEIQLSTDPVESAHELAEFMEHQ